MRALHHREIVRPRVDELVHLERHPIDLVVDNVRSLYNVGSLFRTADAARVRKLWLCGFTPYPPRPEITKTALGAEESVPWEYCRHTAELLQELKKDGRQVVAVEHTDESRSCFGIVPVFPVVLVVGNEITGLSDSVLEECDGAVEIPMFGIKQSLNVSVAAGIVVFDTVRHWLREGMTHTRTNEEGK